jgi:hypothetical protein
MELKRNACAALNDRLYMYTVGRQTQRNAISRVLRIQVVESSSQTFQSSQEKTNSCIAKEDQFKSHAQIAIV